VKESPAIVEPFVPPSEQLAKQLVQQVSPTLIFPIFSPNSLNFRPKSTSATTTSLRTHFC